MPITPGPWNFVDQLRGQVLKKQYNFDVDVLSLFLVTAASNLSNASTLYSGVTNEVAASDAYTLGGDATPMTVTAGRLPTVVFDDPAAWAVASGSLIAHRVGIKHSGGDVIAWEYLDLVTVSPTDAVWGTPTGNAVTITSAGAELPLLVAGEPFEVLDHSDTANNGYYFATGSSTTSSLPATKVGTAPAAAAAEAVDIKRGNDVTIVAGSALVVDADGTPEPFIETA